MLTKLKEKGECKTAIILKIIYKEFVKNISPAALLDCGKVMGVEPVAENEASDFN